MSCWSGEMDRRRMARPSADESGLWQRAMRDVAPLRGRRRSDLVPERRHPAGSFVELAEPTERLGKEAGKMPAPWNKPAAKPEPLDRFAGVDRATADRVRRGRYPVVGRLDL